MAIKRSEKIMAQASALRKAPTKKVPRKKMGEFANRPDISNAATGRIVCKPKPIDKVLVEIVYDSIDKALEIYGKDSETGSSERTPYKPGPRQAMACTCVHSEMACALHGEKQFRILVANAARVEEYRSAKKFPPNSALLEPCPFCKSIYISVFPDRFGKTVHVWCQNPRCNARGPLQHRAVHAVIQWNEAKR